MNVRVPGEGVENLHWFGGIVSALLAFALAGGYLTYRAFRK
jgi:magnesium transporter